MRFKLTSLLILLTAACFLLTAIVTLIHAGPTTTTKSAFRSSARLSQSSSLCCSLPRMKNEPKTQTRTATNLATKN